MENPIDIDLWTQLLFLNFIKIKKEIKITGQTVRLDIIQNCTISWYSKYPIQVGKEMVESNLKFDFFQRAI